MNGLKEIKIINITEADLMDKNLIRYDEFDEESLEHVLGTALALTRLLKSYHDRGYLHLNLRADNLFISNERDDAVYVVNCEEIYIKNCVGKNNFIDICKWMPLEIKMPEMRRYICESTDLYFIGTLMFKKILKRYPEYYDRVLGARYEFDLEDEVLKGISNEVLEGITVFFRRTIQSSVRNRFENAEQAIHSLEEIIDCI